MISRVYGESTIARSKVYEWHRRLKGGRKSIEDDEQAKRPTSRDEENVPLVSECVKKDHRQTLALIAEDTPFSKTSDAVLQEDVWEVVENGSQLCFQKLYERWQKCIIALGNDLEDGCASVLKTIQVMSRKKQRSAFDQASEFDKGRIVAYREIVDYLSVKSVVVLDETKQL
ncbi:hypothetical protein TNCV_2448631 [Trichonephila clavipes]|uniref:Uncharacterized protein n=1 Tax=Trichonephila clavipes TaxID=2585209 RepID=A0A8X6SP72_TRICX|nr:hypothetical protein TNCV_2448631 [Trichonephila clavipes]